MQETTPSESRRRPLIRVWNNEGLAVPITVRAAPWQTTWAYCAYLAILLVALFVLFRRLHQRLRREEEYARRLSLEVASRTEELHQRNRRSQSCE